MRSLKILLSACYCAPHKGSEPGIGWNTAVVLARHHRVWTVTDERHREAIEAELEKNPIPNLHVVYHSVPRWLPVGAGNLYHYMWQVTAALLFRRMQRAIQFDVTHHAALVRYWSPSLLGLLPVPFLWGPVGGGELIPSVLRKDLTWRHRLREHIKHWVLQAARFDPLVRLTARRSSFALANTPETAEKMRRLGCRTVAVLPESGIDQAAMTAPRAEPKAGEPVRFMSMTRLLYWKGVDIGLEAFARIENPAAEYWVVGEGAEEERLRRLSERLGIAEKVRFIGNPPRGEWLELLRQCDALVHPCLCNSGGMISLEAMAAGVPVICIDTGGIRQQVTSECGIRVPVDCREATVVNFSRAMASLAADPKRRHLMGQAARERAESLFSWDGRGPILDRFYTHILTALEKDPVDAADALDVLHTGPAGLLGKQ